MSDATAVPPRRDDVIERAETIAGGGSALAAMLGVRPSAISNWKKDGVPAARVGALSAITGVPPHRIRPDLFPDPSGLVQSAPAPAPASVEAG